MHLSEEDSHSLSSEGEGGDTMAVVHSTGPGVVVVEGGAIHHYTTEEQVDGQRVEGGAVFHTTEEEERNPVVRSSQDILDTVSRYLSPSSTSTQL